LGVGDVVTLAPFALVRSADPSSTRGFLAGGLVVGVLGPPLLAVVIVPVPSAEFLFRLVPFLALGLIPLSQTKSGKFCLRAKKSVRLYFRPFTPRLTFLSAIF
jgi:hypothetical protein